MQKRNPISDAHFIFGTILQMANKMDTLLDRALHKHNLTAKQWFLLAALYYFFESPPTVKELAKEMGSSHQNVKQIALKLERKGMLKLEKDKKDLRAVRIIPTEKFDDWTKDTEAENDRNQFMADFYHDIGKEELKAARFFLSQITRNLEALEEKNT